MSSSFFSEMEGRPTYLASPERNVPVVSISDLVIDTFFSEAKTLKHLPSFSVEQKGTTGDGKPHLQSKLEVVELARKNFKALDENSDGFIDARELAKQVENPEHKGETAQMIAVMYGLKSKIKGFSDDDDSIISSIGISQNDLDKLEQIIRDKQTSNDGCFYTSDFLESVDADKNGKLSTAELRQSVDEGDLPDDVEELFEYFADNDDPCDAVEITDVLHYYMSQSMGSKEERMINKMDFLIRKTWENQIEGASLYADGKTNDGVDMYGIQQGIMGDCYFVASVAAVARTSPETIKQMIVDHKNGTYTVTFPGNKDEPVTVTAPTEAERGLFNGSSEHGIWASVLEKAYGEYCNKHFWRRTPLNLSGGLTTVEGADGGGVFLGKLMRLLTDEGVDNDCQWLTFRSTTRRKLLEHVGGEEKVPVVAWQKPFREYGLTSVSNHVYSVIDFKSEGEGGGTVTLYNPWGHKEDVSLKQFKRRFMSVTYRDK